MGKPRWEEGECSAVTASSSPSSHLSSLRSAVCFPFSSAFTSGSFDCHPAAGSANTLAMGIESDSAKRVGGVGPGKKYCQEISTGNV